MTGRKILSQNFVIKEVIYKTLSLAQSLINNNCSISFISQIFKIYSKERENMKLLCRMWVQTNRKTDKKLKERERDREREIERDRER